MKNALNCLSSSMKSSAKVVDGKLVLSFPGAIKPVVWQMDFSHVKASALEVQESSDGETYTLVLKTPKGENAEIAAFTNKNDAVKGLLAASKALESAQGKIRPSSNNTGDQAAAPKEKSGKSWLALILGAIMLLLLTIVWATLSSPSSTSISTTASTPQNNEASAAGVPLSADEYLRAR